MNQQQKDSLIFVIVAVLASAVAIFIVTPYVGHFSNWKFILLGAFLLVYVLAFSIFLRVRRKKWNGW